MSPSPQSRTRFAPDCRWRTGKRSCYREGNQYLGPCGGRRGLAGTSGGEEERRKQGRDAMEREGGWHWEIVGGGIRDVRWGATLRKRNERKGWYAPPEVHRGEIGERADQR